MYFPIACILVVNLVTCVYVIRLQLKSKKEKARSKGKLPSKILIKSALGLCLILGMTWFVGLIMIADRSPALQWIFTLLNVFQGVWIFVFWVLLHQKVVDGISSKPSSSRAGERGSNSVTSSGVKTWRKNRTGSTDINTLSLSRGKPDLRRGSLASTGLQNTLDRSYRAESRQSFDSVGTEVAWSTLTLKRNRMRTPSMEASIDVNTGVAHDFTSSMVSSSSKFQNSIEILDSPDSSLSTLKKQSSVDLPSPKPKEGIIRSPSLFSKSTEQAIQSTSQPSTLYISSNSAAKSDVASPSSSVFHSTVELPSGVTVNNMPVESSPGKHSPDSSGTASNASSAHAESSPDIQVPISPLELPAEDLGTLSPASRSPSAKGRSWRKMFKFAAFSRKEESRPRTSVSRQGSDSSNSSASSGHGDLIDLSSPTIDESQPAMSSAAQAYAAKSDSVLSPQPMASKGGEESPSLDAPANLEPRPNDHRFMSTSSAWSRNLSVDVIEENEEDDKAQPPPQPDEA